MKFTVDRDQLLKPLTKVAGIVERRQTLPVLSNVLVVVDNDRLSLTGTDLELELVAQVPLSGDFEPGEVTLPARKFVDICKSLPAGSTLEVSQDGDRVVVRCGRSRFTLSTLPASEFPSLEEAVPVLEFSISPDKLSELVDRTAFSMAQQDVRYYLNGMLLESRPGVLRSVATDGHRLAMCDVDVDITVSEPHQVIVPRKGILEIPRLFSDDENPVTVSIGTNHIRISGDSVVFTSKLVDGKFPDYERVLPKGGNRIVTANRDLLRQALQRTAILSNEKYRGVRIELSDGLLTALANNPEQEEAEEQVNVDYNGDRLEVGFNVSYLLDVMNALRTEELVITLGDSNSSALIREKDNDQGTYVVMPMRL